MVAKPAKKKSFAWSSVRVYVEGGGDTRHLQGPIRDGFTRLFLRACPDLVRGTLSVIACGARDEAFKDFKRGIAANPEALCLLLVDSEAPVGEGVGPWGHVRERRGDGWTRPPDVKDGQLHFMVQAMEAWLLADPDALAAYYERGFALRAVLKAKDLESVAKRDLTKSLEKASRGSTKKSYVKAHGFELIGLVDPAKIRQRSLRYGARFFAQLKEALEAIEPGPRRG